MALFANAGHGFIPGLCEQGVGAVREVRCSLASMAEHALRRSSHVISVDDWGLQEQSILIMRKSGIICISRLLPILLPLLGGMLRPGSSRDPLGGGRFQASPA